MVDMADKGFGLSREDTMRMAYTMAEKMGKKHSFKDQASGRGWYERFQRRHPNLSPQSLSYCRALCSNKNTVDKFFNLLTKPMQVFNSDESGIDKPGKVIAQLGRA